MTFLQPTFSIPIFIFFLLLFGYIGVPLWLWSIYFAAVLVSFHISLWILGIFGIAAVIFNVPVVRRKLVTIPIMKVIRRFNILPTISETEKAAIEAGTVWIEGEFFSGAPNLKRLASEPYPQVSSSLQAFLDGPVEQVCRMATDWEIYRRKDLPPEVWDYLKQERFFGMMIPIEYGGLGFSNVAYSTVMVKLASRSFIHTATVGVTNSLGPAKLLLNYGTPAQKDYYLPRLARGDEIPCFALTEPQAGSDAASITSQGIVFRGEDGKLYLRLNFRKRYITLGAIATLIGLAVKLRDPDNLLGKGKDVGITCVLVPANTPGVLLGRRHDPMGVPFYNSPIEGQDVIVPIDQIIGGVEQAGQGWKMLMQTLAAGRGISFPATCTGIAKFVTRVTSAHATVRRQFGLSIGRFEGIEEPLARIAGLTYLMEAARLYTCGAVDQGERPSVVSAIAKYHFTELSRHIINDGMDILGGSGICRGPRNLLANIYIATPIPITVEGSNIITRTLMIFGQGAIRCHPYVYQEIAALNQDDSIAFDRALWHHIGLITRNSFRAILLSLSRGFLARSPVGGATAKYYRKLAWASATFACLTDLALITFGGTLKRHEMLTGRFADVLSWMYLGTATLQRFEAEGRNPNDLPCVHWSMQYTFAQIQQAFEGIFANFSIPVLGAILRGPVAWWWRLNPIGTLPSDTLGHQIAQNLQIPGGMRDRLTDGIYLPSHPDEALGRLEQAFRLSVEAENILKTIKTASRAGQLPHTKPESLIDAALTAGVITTEAAQLVQEAERVRQDAIQVDAFTLQEYQQDNQLSANLATIG
jgi:acyl-CoA dehydrogenase